MITLINLPFMDQKAIRRLANIETSEALQQLLTDWNSDDALLWDEFGNGQYINLYHVLEQEERQFVWISYKIPKHHNGMEEELKNTSNMACLERDNKEDCWYGSLLYHHVVSPFKESGGISEAMERVIDCAKVYLDDSPFNVYDENDFDIRKSEYLSDQISEFLRDNNLNILAKAHVRHMDIESYYGFDDAMYYLQTKVLPTLNNPRYRRGIKTDNTCPNAISLVSTRMTKSRQRSFFFYNTTKKVKNNGLYKVVRMMKEVMK